MNGPNHYDVPRVNKLLCAAKGQLQLMPDGEDKKRVLEALERVHWEWRNTLTDKQRFELRKTRIGP